MTGLRLAVAMVGLWISGFGGGLAFSGYVLDDRPDCPAEDSCTVDYHDGEWHIEEVTP